jgi:hypothetical protein
MKRLIFTIMRRLAIFAVNWVYCYIDVDKDGKLSKKELAQFSKKLKSLMRK